MRNEVILYLFRLGRRRVQLHNEVIRRAEGKASIQHTKLRLTLDQLARLSALVTADNVYRILLLAKLNGEEQVAGLMNDSGNPLGLETKVGNDRSNGSHIKATSSRELEADIIVILI